MIVFIPHWICCATTITTCTCCSEQDGQHCAAKNPERIQVFQVLIDDHFYNFFSFSSLLQIIHREVVKSKEIAESGVQLELVSLHIFCTSVIDICMNFQPLLPATEYWCKHYSIYISISMIWFESRWQMTSRSWQALWQDLLTLLTPAGSSSWR